MEYSEAKNIRGKSFGSMLSEHEGGLGSSLKAVVSQKTKAKMTGLKETFDPMNIAKVMTGGSNWAPALLGKLTGRKQSSIDYFSGVKRKKGTAEKLGPIANGTGGDFLGILQSIESLLHTSREEDKLRMEEEKNFAEEKELEKQRRHKELIQAITGKPYKEKVVQSASKEDERPKEPNAIDGIFDLLFDRVINKLMDKFAKWFALSEVLGGTTLPVLGSVYAALLAPWLLNAYQRSEIEKDPNNPEWKDTPYAKFIRGEAKTQGAAAAQNQRSVVKQVTPQYAKELLSASPKFTDAELMDETGKNRKELEEWIATNPKTNLKFEKNPIPTQSNQTNGSEQFKKEAEEFAQKNSPDAAKLNQPTPVVTETPKTSQVLNQLQKENNDLNIPVSKPDPSTVVNNTSATTSSGGKKRDTIPLVRNQEETLQRLIFNSTRVV